MSPKMPVGPVTGSGPGGRIDIRDIQTKLEQIRGDAEETTERNRPVAVMGAVAGVVVLVGIAFIMGRRRGRRRSTWVEIRRL
jgi:hypothetical protein